MSNPPLIQLQGKWPVGGAKSSISLPIALQVADSYFDAGSRDYHLLHDYFDSTNRASANLDFDRALTFGVPAVSNLSFSLEIFLKVLRAQHDGLYPTGHKIATLFDDLPSEAQDRIKQSFAESCRDDPFSYLTVFTIKTSTRKESNGLSLQIVASDEGQLDPNDPTAVSTAVKMATDLFTVWRYIYEHGARAGELTADFFGLIHLIRAVRTDVTAFKGAASFRGQ